MLTRHTFPSLVSFICLFLLLMLVPSRARSTQDVPFGTNGYKTFDINGQDRVQDALVTNDGKIVLLINSYRMSSVVKINVDGSFDTSFGINGVASLSADDGITLLTESRLSSAPGEKFLITNSTCIGCFTRILANGQVDTSFGSLGTINFQIAANYSSNNGYFWLPPIWSNLEDRFLIMQAWASQSGRFYTIKKFKSDLTLDTSFGVNGILNLGPGQSYPMPSDWFPSAEGGIVIAGFIYDSRGDLVTKVERRLSNGQLDSGFGNSGVTVHKILNESTMFNQWFAGPDGSIWGLGGYYWRTSNFLIKMGSNGTSDALFGTNGRIDTGISSNYSAILPLSDGGVIYATTDAALGIRVYKFTQRGLLSTDYGLIGGSQVVPSIVVTKVIQDQFGQVIVAGGTNDGIAVRYGERGILDSPSSWLSATSSLPSGSNSSSTLPSGSNSSSSLPSGSNPSSSLPSGSNSSSTTSVVPVQSPSSTAVRIGKTVSAKSMATVLSLKVLSTSKVSLKVLSSSVKYCKVSGTTLKGVKAGWCKVTVTVTPKKGRATSKTVTLKVTR